MKRKNTLKGFLTLFGSMMLYAFSGVVVVGLSQAFGSIGQVTFRALAALILTIVFLLIGGFRYKFSKNYEKKWLIIDVFCRPIFNICFVYAVLSIGPTAALFYLFASKVITGGLIRIILGDKKPFEWFDYLSYGIVLVGLFIFTYPIGSVLSIGILLGCLSGSFEAVKSEAMSRIHAEQIDKPVVALYEFASLGVITAILVLITGQSFVVATITPIVWLVLLASAVIAVGSLLLELTGFGQYDPDLGNAVLASEMGFAGVINYLILGTLMSNTQIVGAALLILSLAVVGIASYFRNENK